VGNFTEKTTGKRKAPLPMTTRGLEAGRSVGRSTARTATGSTTATAAERVGRGDGKSGTVSSFDEINFNGTAFIVEVSIHQKFQAAFFVHFIAFFWLIQSQTQ
jgi:hypothetical protein